MLTNKMKEGLEYNNLWYMCSEDFKKEIKGRFVNPMNEAIWKIYVYDDYKIWKAIQSECFRNGYRWKESGKIFLEMRQLTDEYPKIIYLFENGKMEWGLFSESYKSIAELTYSDVFHNHEKWKHEEKIKVYKVLIKYDKDNFKVSGLYYKSLEDYIKGGVVMYGNPISLIKESEKEMTEEEYEKQFGITISGGVSCL